MWRGCGLLRPTMRHEACRPPGVKPPRPQDIHVRHGWQQDGEYEYLVVEIRGEHFCTVFSKPEPGEVDMAGAGGGGLAAGTWA